MKFILSLTLSFFALLSLNAQRIDTVKVHSQAMDRDILNIVVTPAQYNDAYAMPVVYLLHGHGGNHKDWVMHTQPKLPQLANQYGIILVCPNGDQSWYFDSYTDPKCQFETYVSKELVEYVDKNYPAEKILKIEKNRNDYEVKLSNRLELKFDKNFNLYDIDD